MRRIERLFFITFAICAASAGYSELQNITVGGSIHITGHYYNMDSLGKMSYLDQRTRLHVKADFTNDVSAFIEFDYYSGWGEGFRSLYLSGENVRAPNDNTVDLYQGYLEARNLWGMPLSLRVGRQELRFGSEWLVGSNYTTAALLGPSFDALRLSYAHDVFTLDVAAAKLAETGGDFLEGDTDFYLTYFSYIGIEDIVLDAYWMFLRDDGVALGDRVQLHTLGMRAAGVVGNFDFEVEGAYQFGNIYGRPSACPAGFGEADVVYNDLGVNSELGYSVDVAWQPRAFARFAYLGGGNPKHYGWRTNDRVLPFNRLFSNWEYTEFLADTDASNMFYYAVGLDIMPTETLELELIAACFRVDKRAPDLWYWFNRDRAGRTLGYELGIYADYHYTEDLTISAGFAHFFGRRGLERTPVTLNGLAPFGGNRSDSYDYLFIETTISF